jgi:hypothetical protein
MVPSKFATGRLRDRNRLPRAVVPLLRQSVSETTAKLATVATLLRFDRVKGRVRGRLVVLDLGGIACTVLIDDPSQ